MVYILPPWYLKNSKNWLIFSHVEKNCQKKVFFCAGPPPPPKLNVQIRAGWHISHPCHRELKFLVLYAHATWEGVWPISLDWRPRRSPQLKTKQKSLVFRCLFRGIKKTYVAGEGNILAIELSLLDLVLVSSLHINYIDVNV